MSRLIYRFFIQEDCIVICVDWEAGASLPNYVKAAANTRLVGKQLAMLLKGLQDFKGLELARVHLIGFSLGAHVSGFAGSDLPGLKRITGLDPAGPLFEAQHPKARLDSTDANFVDVIHSNGENLILGGLGKLHHCPQCSHCANQSNKWHTFSRFMATNGRR